MIKISKKVICSIKTKCRFDTRCLTDEENVKRMNEQMGKNIRESERKIEVGRLKEKDIGKIGT